MAGEPKSLAFTKQLALSFIALVLLLFMVTTNRYAQPVEQMVMAGDVNGVMQKKTQRAAGMESTGSTLTCDTCVAEGMKGLCFSRIEKKSACVNALPRENRGGIQCVACGNTPANPSPTKCPMKDYPNPPAGCRYERGCVGTQCPICPEYTMVCDTDIPVVSQ